MPLRLAAIIVGALAFVPGAHAQHQPYAGQQQRDIKALSADEIKQYLEGAGMAYARSAELNHYPGPAHALELADSLGLTAGQRAQTRSLMEEHRAEARSVGAKVVEAERALETLFSSGKVDQASLAEAVRTTAALQVDYRLSHLETHRRLRALLTEEQVARYDRLRGYASAGEQPTHKH